MAQILRDRYPEMDMAGDDCAVEQLVGDLHRMDQAARSAALPREHEMRIAAALQVRVAPAERTGGVLRRVHSPLRRHRPFAFAAVAVCILMLTSATYAAVPILTRVFDLGGAGSVIQRHLGKAVHVSQTLAGYTMTIERVYADPNRFLIAYSIRPPVSSHRLWNMSTGNITLTDGQGTVLPERNLVGDVGTTEPETTLQGFDAAAITGQPTGLHLHLTAPWIDAMEQLHPPPRPGQPSMQEFAGLPTAGAFGSVAITRPVNERDPWMQIVRAYGPISFDLTVPVERAQEVLKREQVSATGVTAALKRVAISPIETRLYVSGLQPNTFGVLSTPDGEVRDAASTSWRWHDMTVYSFATDLTNTHGDWTFTVKPTPALHLPPGATPPSGSDPAEGGPWTFHFAVP